MLVPAHFLIFTQLSGLAPQWDPSGFAHLAVLCDLHLLPLGHLGYVEMALWDPQQKKTPRSIRGKSQLEEAAPALEAAEFHGGKEIVCAMKSLRRDLKKQSAPVLPKLRVEIKAEGLWAKNGSFPLQGKENRLNNNNNK